jgi:endoglucanase
MKLLALLLAVGAVVPALAQTALPLRTDSRWVLDANGERVKLKCVNWAGHMEPNTPEGLHKQSIEYIADFVAEQGFNCVRLTFSIDHARAPDVKVSEAFTAAAEPAGVSVDDMNNLYSAVAQKNPSFTADTTTRDVFEAVIAALWARGVMTILDNHVSKASWCCKLPFTSTILMLCSFELTISQGNLDDGNGWWDEGFGYNDLNSRYFKTQEWLDGLTAIATWATTQQGVVGISLRNEIRELLPFQGLDNRGDWYNFMKQAGERVHEAHPDVLVIAGGTLGGTDLSHLKLRDFDFSAWAGKLLWEWHAYSYTVNFPNSGEDCGFTKGQYGFNNGFVLEQGRSWTGPLILSEFGFGMAGGERDGLNDQDRTYFDCIKEYVLENDSEWAIWGLMGSYYVREGQVDYDEGYGVMDRDWVGLRNSRLPELLGEMFNTHQFPE